MDSKIKLNFNGGINSDQELRDLAKLLDVHIDDIVDIQSVDRLPQRGSFIILLRRDQGIGHFTCLYDGMYFDSFAVGPPMKIKAKSYNKIQLQGAERAYCGIFCLLWLYSKQHNRPDLMNGFTDLNVEVSSNWDFILSI